MKPSKSNQGSLIELWLASLSPGLRFAALLMSAEEQKQAFADYRAALHMSPRKLALKALREHHPLEVINDPDEALLRGVSEKTYRGMRDRAELK